MTQIQFSFYCCAIFAAMLILASSCAQEGAPVQDPVARALDKYLYPGDISELTDDNLNPSDSAVIVGDFIDQWIKHQLILDVAEANLEAIGTLDEIDRQAQEFRETLLIEAYMRNWLASELDTAVGQEEIAQFYESNEGQFMLREDVFRMNYLTAPGIVANFDSALYWFEKAEQYRGDLERFCIQNNIRLYLDKETWFSLSDLRELLPDVEITEEMLIERDLLDLDSRNGRFVMQVNSRRIKGNEAPLAYVSHTIEQRILNSRRKELVKSTYRNLFIEGGKRNQYEIYTREE